MTKGRIPGSISKLCGWPRIWTCDPWLCRDALPTALCNLSRGSNNGCPMYPKYMDWQTDMGKQCRPRSDSTEHFAWWRSTLPLIHRFWTPMQVVKGICSNFRKCIICINAKLLSSALSSACDFKSHFCKQSGPRSDCSFRSSLIRVHIVCRYAKNRFEKFARIFSRRRKQTTFSDAVFLGPLRVKISKFWR